MTFHSFDENPSLMESFQKNDLSFESIGLDPNIVHSIYGLINHGSSIKPSSIQFGVIPVILQKKNVLFSAETGSGKTIAYLAPIIQLINQYKRSNSSNRKSPFGLVLLPSRELTEQVGNVAQQLATNTNVGVATMVGGIPKHIKHSGMDLIITTIGMVDSHVNKG